MTVDTSTYRRGGGRQRWRRGTVVYPVIVTQSLNVSEHVVHLPQLVGHKLPVTLEVTGQSKRLVWRRRAMLYTHVHAIVITSLNLVLKRSSNNDITIYMHELNALFFTQVYYYTNNVLIAQFTTLLELAGSQ